jgi:cardiolipin synthase A/B
VAVETRDRVTVRKRKRSRGRASLVSAAGSRWHAVRERYKWWQITLFLVGALSAVSIISALFFAVGDKPSRIYTEREVPPVDSAQFATALAGLVGAPVEHGGHITILNNGDEFFPDLLKSIRNAKHSINFSVYIWKDGEVSDAVLPALIERQRHGVKVRVLLDGLGAIATSDKDFEPLVKAGGIVQKFRTPKFGKLTRFHRRNHRRSIVIDGEVGYTGGMAVSDVWLGHAQDEDHWRDLMFKLTGQPAQSLQSAFVDTWSSSSGELLVGPEIYPSAVGAGGGVGAGVAAAGGLDRFVHLANSPADDDQSMSYFFLLPIFSARHSIHLTTPYFIPDKHLLNALVEKAKAGVDVTLLVPGPHTDNWITRASAQARYQALLEAGAKIYEYEPTFVHAKYLVIDGMWSVIGSPNLNFRSRQLDEENAFGVFDPALAGQLGGIFEKDLRKAKRIDLQQWLRRNPMQHMFETFSRVLDQQS